MDREAAWAARAAVVVVRVDVGVRVCLLCTCVYVGLYFDVVIGEWL